jgi:hypothetical protein
MSTLMDQLAKLEEQRKTLISGVLGEIEEKIRMLNSAGFHYRLVEGLEGESRRGGAGQKRLTTEAAFLGKVKAAAFRRWGKMSDERKEQLWHKEQPLAKKFYGEKYENGVNKTGEKYRVQTVPSSK